MSLSGRRRPRLQNVRGPISIHAIDAQFYFSKRKKEYPPRQAAFVHTYPMPLCNYFYMSVPESQCCLLSVILSYEIRYSPLG